MSEEKQNTNNDHFFNPALNGAKLPKIKLIGKEEELKKMVEEVETQKATDDKSSENSK